jgi:DNA-binding MarR family transcriptional regulator
MIHPTLRFKRAYLALRRAVDDAIKPYGFTAAQFDVIQLLLHEGELEHRQLQERLAMASPTLTNILDGMIREGFVDRTVDEDDGRVRRISLGKATQSFCQSSDFKAAGDALVSKMFKGLTRAEREQFLVLLDRIDANLSA